MILSDTNRERQKHTSGSFARFSAGHHVILPQKQYSDYVVLGVLGGARKRVQEWKFPILISKPTADRERIGNTPFLQHPEKQLRWACSPQ